MILKDAFERATPYFAAGIFITLIILSSLLYQENQITKTINEECGWENERWRCICDESFVTQFEKIVMDDAMGVENVTLVW